MLINGTEITVFAGNVTQIPSVKGAHGRAPTPTYITLLRAPTDRRFVQMKKGTVIWST